MYINVKKKEITAEMLYEEFIAEKRASGTSEKSECNGSQLTVKALWRSINRYCKRKNVEPLGVHALRHNFAKSWIKNGGNAFVLKKVLTHSNIAMTQKYVRLFDNEIKGDVQKYNALSNLEKGD